jgi:hypothetical protein
MRAVLYSKVDLEPITVVDVPIQLFNHLKRYRWLRLAVLEPFRLTLSDECPFDRPVKTVDITAEFFQYYDQEMVLLFTRDEEAALLLRPDLLPGQRRLVKEEFQRGFAAGWLKAIRDISADYGPFDL